MTCSFHWCRPGRRCGFLVLALACTSACKTDKGGPELPEPGFRDATDAAPAGTHLPLVRGDRQAITETGRWIDQGRRAMVLAEQALGERVGPMEGDLVIPLVDVDPGGRSAQVVFFRWPQGARPGARVDPEQGQRWVLVSLRLAPDAVIDLELLHGIVEPGSAEAQRLAALWAAGQQLQTRAPGQAFYTFDRVVVEPTGQRRPAQRNVVVVYAMAVPSGPDFEVVISEPGARGRGAGQVLRSIAVHTPWDPSGNELALELPDPHPLSVARALQSGTALTVRSQSGVYRVNGDTGLLEPL